jgi:hypothetical protein
VADRGDSERRRDDPIFQLRIEDEPPCQPAARDESGRREEDEEQKMPKKEERCLDEVNAFAIQCASPNASPGSPACPRLVR